MRLAWFTRQAAHFPAATRLAERDLGEWLPQITKVQGEVGRALTLAVALCRRFAAELSLAAREPLLGALTRRVTSCQQANS